MSFTHAWVNRKRLYTHPQHARDPEEAELHKALEEGVEEEGEDDQRVDDLLFRGKGRKLVGRWVGVEGVCLSMCVCLVCVVCVYGCMCECVLTSTHLVDVRHVVQRLRQPRGMRRAVL